MESMIIITQKIIKIRGISIITYESNEYIKDLKTGVYSKKG